MLKGKTIFVTGTNRGLGQCILKTCAENGANVIAHARKKTDEFVHDCDEVAAKCGVKVIPIFFDMTDAEGMEMAVRELIRSKVVVDGLVNSAGVGFWSYFQLMPMEKVQAMLDVNLLGPMRLTQLLLRPMTRKGGSIVNIASVAGIDLSAGNCAYGVSKAALIAFTKSLASESGQFNVRANAIAPSLMQTDMGNGMGAKEADNSLASAAIKRLCTVDDITETVVFLLSDKASYINGQVVVVNGGKK